MIDQELVTRKITLIAPDLEKIIALARMPLARYLKEGGNCQKEGKRQEGPDHAKVVNQEHDGHTPEAGTDQVGAIELRTSR